MMTGGYPSIYDLKYEVYIQILNIKIMAAH